MAERGIMLDDRYFCYNGYTYLQAHDSFRKRGLSMPPFGDGRKDYKDAGLSIFSNKKHHCIIGLSKGGVVKVWDKRTGKMVMDDCGIRGALSNGTPITSQWLDKGYEYDFGKEHVSVSGDMHLASQTVPTPQKAIALRYIQSTIGRSQKASDMLKRKLREKTITKSARAPVRFERSVRLGDSITIKDKATLLKRARINEMSLGGKFSITTIPSSRYFRPHEIVGKREDLSEKQVAELNRRRSMEFSRRV
jgi:hypothetical protein